MRVRLLAFAIAADRIGARETTARARARARPSATCAAPPSGAGRRSPALAPRLAIAVDGAVAADERAARRGRRGRAAPSRLRRLSRPCGPRSSKPRSTRRRSLAEVAAPSARRAGALRRRRARPPRGARGHRHPLRLLPRDGRGVLAAIAADLDASTRGSRPPSSTASARLAAGEASIAIACAAPRRDAAFAAARRALERVKREAPIWKLERYGDGGEAWRLEEPLAPPGSAEPRAAGGSPAAAKRSAALAAHARRPAPRRARRLGSSPSSR